MRWFGVVLGIVALMATACGGGPKRDETVWSPCPGVAGDGRVWECATITAPRDYRAPGAGTIDLALIRTRSADPARRLGSLVYNPGGPGGSGLETVVGVASRFSALLDRYDLVSWDPRGAGRSSAVDCSDGGLPERVPRTDAEWAAIDAGSEQFADSCVAASGPLLAHIGLFDSARDIDLVRAAVGDEKLNYLGVSYGGQLGAAYATLFPQRVGRMLLDAPGTPLRTFRQSLLDQSAGSEAALRQFLSFCVAQGNCPLGGTEQAASDGIDAFLARVEVSPLSTDRGAPLTRPVATAALGLGVAAPEVWPHLTTALAHAYSGNGNELIGYADLFAGRRPDGSRSNFASINTAANCADYPDFYSIDQVRGILPEFAEVSPRFGELTGLRLAECTHWPVHGVGRAPLSGAGAAPIVLIGNTGDPEAPIEWVSELAQALASGVLVTYHGVGHGAYGGVNDCVDRVVNAYLREGAVPERGTVCR
ncbi:alpha/beta hydrolase [Nocardia colli]|uniref:Alpha/beta hydrolase n=1 Tax=Nocardia colli TaxID=2545717 RepID=A0A5N0ECU7_9NOCA|nr:alpha/beta hydrolase [Nocardia colli]KAA8887248.1 alpha/beta hydrolase [Nocardia colli]